MLKRGMKTVLGLSFVLFSLLILEAQANNNNVADFISSRQIICTVQFELGSSNLSDSAKATLNGVAASLDKINKNEAVVRIEGFSSPDGTELANLNLSMSRAQVVENYLREKYSLPMDRYLIGRGVNPDSGLSKDKQRRVEIAVYDNLLNIETSKVDTVSIDR